MGNASDRKRRNGKEEENEKVVLLAWLLIFDRYYMALLCFALLYLKKGWTDGLLRSIKSCVRFSIDFLVEFFFDLSSSSFTPFSSFTIITITITITNHLLCPLLLLIFFISLIRE